MFHINPGGGITHFRIENPQKAARRLSSVKSLKIINCNHCLFQNKNKTITLNFFGGYVYWVGKRK
jgi:hypothetical protein